LIADNTDFNM